MIKVTKGDENLDSNDGLYTEPKQKPNKQERGGSDGNARTAPFPFTPSPENPSPFLTSFHLSLFQPLSDSLSNARRKKEKKNLTPSSFFSLNRKTTQQRRKTTPFSRKATTSSKLFFSSLFSLFRSHHPTEEPTPSHGSSPLFISSRSTFFFLPLSCPELSFVTSRGCQVRRYSWEGTFTAAGIGQTTRVWLEGLF